MGKLTVLVAVVALAACGKSSDVAESSGEGSGTSSADTAAGCTEIGCSDGLNLDLTPASGEFAAGLYELTMTADGPPEVCTMEVSDDPADCATTPCVIDSTCNAVYFLQEQPQRIAITVGGTPAALDLAISRDGNAIVDESLAPQYMEFQPNGPDCPPTCRQASEQVSIPD